MSRGSYESVPEQLRKCSGAVTKVFRNSYKFSVAVKSLPDQLRKCSGAVMKVFRSSYKSVPEQL